MKTVQEISLISAVNFEESNDWLPFFATLTLNKIGADWLHR